jgi:hypothetical protein
MAKSAEKVSGNAIVENPLAKWDIQQMFAIVISCRNFDIDATIDRRMNHINNCSTRPTSYWRN